MNINEYLQTRSIAVNSVTTGNIHNAPSQTQGGKVQNFSDSPFANELKSQLEKNKVNQNNGVEFSKHAMERIAERNIDLNDNDTLERLNKGVELAEGKGSNDTLVIVDSNAFVVSVRNNKVITTMTADDMQGNVFTNIDSTVIM